MNQNTVLNLNESQMNNVSIIFKAVMNVFTDKEDLVLVFAKINDIRTISRFGIEVVVGLKDEHPLSSKPALALKKAEKMMSNNIRAVCNGLGFELFKQAPEVSMKRNQVGETMRFRYTATSIPSVITQDISLSALTKFIDMIGLDIVEQDELDGFHGFQVKPKDVDGNMKELINTAVRVGKTLLVGDCFYIYPAEGFEGNLSGEVILTRPDDKKQYNIERGLGNLGIKFDESLLPSIKYKLYDLGLELVDISMVKKAVVINLSETGETSISVAKLTEFATEFRKVLMGHDFKFNINNNSMIASLLEDSKSIIYNPDFKEKESKLVKVEDIHFGEKKKESEYTKMVSKITSGLALGLTSLNLDEKELASITPSVNANKVFSFKYSLNLSKRGITDVIDPKIENIRTVVEAVAKRVFQAEFNIEPKVSSGVSLGSEDLVMSVNIVSRIDISQVKHSDYATRYTTLVRPMTVEEVRDGSVIPYNRTNLDSFFAWLKLMNCQTELRELSDTVSMFTVFHGSDFELSKDVRRAIMTFRQTFLTPFIRLAFVELASTKEPFINQVEEIKLYIEKFKEVECDVLAHPEHIEVIFKKATMDEIVEIRDTINYAYTSKEFKAFNQVAKPKKVLILNEIPNLPKEVVTETEVKTDDVSTVSRKLKTIFDIISYTPTKNNMKTITDLKVILDNYGLVMDVSSSLFDVHVPVISLIRTKEITDGEYLSAIKLISEFWKEVIVYYKSVTVVDGVKQFRPTIKDQMDSVLAYMFGGLGIHIHSTTLNEEDNEVTIVTSYTLSKPSLTMIKDRSRAAFGYRSEIKLYINPLGSREEQETLSFDSSPNVKISVDVPDNEVTKDIVETIKKNMMDSTEVETKLKAVSKEGKDMMESKEVIGWLLELDMVTGADTFKHIQELVTFVHAEELSIEKVDTDHEKMMNHWLIHMVGGDCAPVIELNKYISNLMPDYKSIFQIEGKYLVTDRVNFILNMSRSDMEKVELQSSVNGEVLHAVTSDKAVIAKIEKLNDELYDLYRDFNLPSTFQIHVVEPVEEVDAEEFVNTIEAKIDAVEEMDQELIDLENNTVAIEAGFANSIVKESIENKLNVFLKDHIGVEVFVAEDNSLGLDFYDVEGVEKVSATLDQMLMLMSEFKEVKSKYGYDFEDPKEALDWFEPTQVLAFFETREKLQTALAVLL